MILADVLPNTVRIRDLSGTNNTLLGQRLASDRILEQVHKLAIQLQLLDVILIQDATRCALFVWIKARTCLEADM